MYTETELRDALRHSAARADTLPEPDHHADIAVLEPMRLVDGPTAGRTRAPARWWRIALPTAAAAAVVAATVTGVLATRSDRPGHNAAAPPPTHSSPTATHASVAALPSPDVDTSQVVDLVQARSGGDVDYQIGNMTDSQAGAETLRKPLGEIEAISVTVVPKNSPHFDAGRIPRDHPVRIAGTTGFYSFLKLFPIDGDHKRFSDKWLKHWTIAFRTPHGDWAFAYFDNATSADDPNSTDVSIDDPARIVKAYDKLGVSFTADRTRLPYRFGYLPSGVQFGSAMVEAGTSDPRGTSLSLADGDRTLDVSLTAGPRIGGQLHCVVKSECGHMVQVHRKVDGYDVQLTANRYSTAEAQRVLDGITLPRDVHDPSTWFTIADSIG